MLGDWAMDTASITDGLAADAPEDAEFTAEGDSLVTFGPDTMVVTMDFTSTFSIPAPAGATGPDLEGSSVADGSYEAEYSIDGDRMVYGDLVDASGGIVNTTQGGQAQPQQFEDVATGLEGQESVLTCDGDELTIAPVGVADALTQVFTRE
ncbi:hypothetical protein GCM10025875_01770 [Litorihabitans aurantiacus]|uniref:Lipocalin-like domain-containing protein n=1 Tax=Litorihabitans aurantiacus TaxID=1930061 RepID=A0AA37URC2_9MICO|nr:hypothetical protein GCM10025875_01770 [Litorihabitans aurantiacus]